MTVLLVMAISVAVLAIGGRFYSAYVARKLGEDPTRPTPAVAKADGRDYVPTPTPVVFAHHFASIAGAGPILGPVIAIVFGWAPALIWVLGGGVLIGAVHDYLATYMATREGGTSIATIVRRIIGRAPFVAITILLVLMLALVCAAFLNASAKALTSTVPFDRVGLPLDQETFRVEPGKAVPCREGIDSTLKLGQKEVVPRKQLVEGRPVVFYNQTVEGREVTVSKAEIVKTEMVNGKETIVRKRPLQVVIGGIASMSVVCITAVAPLIGWLYLKRKLSVWICSVLAILICGVSITVGVFVPIALNPLAWKLLLSAYVLVAAGVPVWIFLQSRDFINVHILYVGMGALLVTLIVAGARGAGSAEPIPAFNFAEGVGAKGPVWPMLFILIACGAVSGFHSLCAGGTTCKQLTSETATRRIGYYGMLLESFLAVCVIAVMMIGAVKLNYLIDVHPKYAAGAYGGEIERLFGHTELGDANWVLGFAMAVGNAVHQAFDVPIVVGALAGMVLLEGFLVTTLDTAIRLTRYLIEEIWRALLGRYDVFAEPVAQQESQQWGRGEQTPAGAGGIPVAPPQAEQTPLPPTPEATRGLKRKVLLFMRQYWFNSGLAVGIMLLFALTGAQGALWKIFATSNQLLAAMVLSLAALWLLRKGRKAWFAIVPAVLMLATTAASLILLLVQFLRDLPSAPGENAPLLAADIVIMVITAYLLFAGVREAARVLARGRAPSPAS